MQQVIIVIDENKTIPECIQHFTPEENLLMLQIGSAFVLEGTRNISPILMKDLIQEKQSEISALKNELESQKRFHEAHLENFVEIKLENKELVIDDLKKQVLELSKKIEIKDEEYQKYKQSVNTSLTRDYEQKVEILNIKIQKEKEFYEKERERNERALEKLQEMMQITSSKSSVKLGIEGEHIFGELANRAFRDFDKFYYKYTGDQTSKGDYHLYFKDFSVLVDTKNYSGNVTNTSKKKFRYDIENNKHMKIAWLISLNSNIDSFDKYPIMFEMINEQYIFYINNLMKYEEPVEMLRLIWSVSNNINTLLSNKETGQEDLNLYKNKIESIVKELDKISQEDNLLIIEMTKNLEKMRQNKRITKNFLLELLNDKINEEINTEYATILQEQLIDTIRNWCQTRLKVDSENQNRMKYSEIWDKFDKDIQNKRYNVKKLKFKEYILEIYRDNLLEHSKYGELVGINWI